MPSALRAFLLLLIAAPVTAGCAAEAGGEDEEEWEEEPGDQTSDELRSAVSCKERRETAYDRGKPSSITVITIGGKPVAKPTGHAFLKMQAAAEASGVRLSLTSGFRTMEQQRHLYSCYTSSRCNAGRLAAKPGFSNHQNGLALDMSTSRWLAENGSKFGFVRTVPREPWHWEYQGGKDPGGPCSSAAAE